jgi:hypothetical protein
MTTPRTLYVDINRFRDFYELFSVDMAAALGYRIIYRYWGNPEVFHP